VDEPRHGDLVTYGDEETTHIAFWLGDGRILHATGGRGVVEEAEPGELREIRRRFVRFEPRL
jgi:cell wall-associated NlpC family hydrolase